MDGDLEMVVMMMSLRKKTRGSTRAERRGNVLGVVTLTEKQFHLHTTR